MSAQIIDMRGDSFGLDTQAKLRSYAQKMESLINSKVDGKSYELYAAPEFRSAIVGILEAYQISGHDQPGEVKALHNFVRDKIKFIRSPIGMQIWQTPMQTLKCGYGDCGNFVIFLAAALKAIGFKKMKMRFVDTGCDGKISHVFLELWSNRLEQYVPLDPTSTQHDVGWCPKFTVKYDYEL